MNFSSPKTILAHVDQSYFFRQGLKLSLSQSVDYDLKISVGNVDSLLKRLNSKQVDIILLGDYDYSEYPVDILLLKLMNDHPKSLPVALQSITKYDEINQLIKMGIRSFIPKQIPEKEFFASLTKVKRDGFFFDAEITKNLIEKVQKEQKLSDLNLSFSGIEKQILQHVSHGCTAEEISGKLNKSKKTIEGYRYRMLKKAKVKNIAELVAWGFRNKVIT